MRHRKAPSSLARQESMSPRCVPSSRSFWGIARSTTLMTSTTTLCHASASTSTVRTLLMTTPSSRRQTRVPATTWTTFERRQPAYRLGRWI